MNFKKFARYFQTADSDDNGPAQPVVDDEIVTDQHEHLETLDNNISAESKSIQSCDSGIMDGLSKGWSVVVFFYAWKL